MEKDELIKPLQLGVSVINENPIGVLEKLGKYEFIYDYAIPNPIFSNLLKGQSFPQPVKVNSEAQVGVFSKGNIVKVVRFDGNNAIIENINYKAPDPNIVKTVWGELIGGFLNRKEFSIPKDYLRKVDDTLEPTLLTGIDYGANMKPQPVYDMPPVKQVPFNPVNETILEENASFVLARDFQYVSSWDSSFCSPDGFCATVLSPKYSTLKAGTKVTGRLVRRSNNVMFIKAPTTTTSSYNDFLSVKGYGSQGSIDIPIEYLKRDDGDVVSVENNNKNLLMIVGAFLVGYLLFNKQETK